MMRTAAFIIFGWSLAITLHAAESFDPVRVRLLDGPFKSVQELHRTGWLAQMDIDRLLHPYRRVAGLPQPNGVIGYGGWDDTFCAGHMGGHYLSAAARMYAATGDITLRNRAVAMVAVLAECQQQLGGGFLAAFPESMLEHFEQEPSKGVIPFYLIHKVLAGLVDVSELCHNDQAFLIAERLSDHLAAVHTT